jgi:predicted restriction endonuclease
VGAYSGPSDDCLSGGVSMGVKREACDIWFSKCVRHRDQHRCQYCFNEGTDCAHIFGRAKKSVRWSMDNAVTLCRYHHRWFGENPVAFTDWLTKTLGHGHMDLLREKANATLKTNKVLRKEISDHYRAELRAAEAEPKYEIVSYN